MKIISGIIFPNDGTVELNGTVSSLINLNAGLDPDFTGRENIYHKATLLGMLTDTYPKESMRKRLHWVNALSVSDIINSFSEYGFIPVDPPHLLDQTYIFVFVPG